MGYTFVFPFIFISIHSCLLHLLITVLLGCCRVWLRWSRLFLLLLNLLHVLDARIEERVGVVSDVITNCVLVREFVNSETGDLVEVLPLLFENCTHVTLGETICAYKLLELIVTESLEWAAMELTVSRSLLVDDLLAVPRSIVISLTFLSEHVSNVVCIILLKLIAVP